MFAIKAVRTGNYLIKDDDNKIYWTNRLNNATVFPDQLSLEQTIKENLFLYENNENFIIIQLMKIGDHYFAMA